MMSTAGWAFPPVPVAPRGGLNLTAGAALVRQSVRLILETEPGERVMRPEFGCGLRGFLMAPNTPGTRAAIGRAVRQALSRWEPRITLRDVEVIPADDPSVVIITISYTHVEDGTENGLGLPLTISRGT